MIYFVSGASRSGKTLLAKTILEENNIPYLSLDWLMMGFNDGFPDIGIHHLLWPNEIAEKMWPFFKGMVDNMLSEDTDYVIEGEAMLPELMSELLSQYPDQIKVAFLGFSTIDINKKISLIKSHCEEETDWLTSESDDYIQDHVENMILYSKMIREACSKYQLPYFDTSENFESTKREVKQFLLS